MLVNARKVSDVGALFKGSIRCHFFKQVLIGEDNPGHPHAGLVFSRYPPRVFVNSFKGYLYRAPSVFSFVTH